MTVLAGKTALITAGAGGISSACATTLVRDGAAVVLMGRRLSALEQAKEKITASLSAEGLVVPEDAIQLIAGDGLKKADVVAALDLAESIRGGLDICVAAVGGGEIKPLLLHDEESFMTEVQFNLQGTFLVLRHATPIMAAGSGGSIVCISSDAAKLVFPWLPAYTTAKCALEGLVRSAAEELSRFNIRVNAVRPGLTRTESTQGLFDNEEVYQRFASEKPLGRLGEPEDIAAGVRYLAGPESSWVTGQSFAIEGGNELRKAADMSPMVEQIYGREVFDKVLSGIDPIR